MILALNAGSSSLKYKLFENNLKVVLSGEFHNTRVHKAIFATLIAQFGAKRYHALSHDNALKVVHRVVHGGKNFYNPVSVTRRVEHALKKIQHLAPLHNPYNLKGITLAKKYFKRAHHYAVFDTGFFQTLPKVAKLYPLPFTFAKIHGLERFGFHGISHEYALHIAREKLRKKNPNLITLHLGAGCSITAIQKGKPCDTSMGYTPLEGLIMWTRAGDIDPGMILHSRMSKHTWQTLLEHHAGLKGMTGLTDYLELLQYVNARDPRAVLAFDMFIYRIQKYIGAYFAALRGKVDALAFTGKIGAGLPITRNRILAGLPFMQRIPVIVIEPNEEWLMAKKVQKMK